MKKLACLSLCLGCLAVLSASAAVDFKKSKVTQVVNDVQIISAADQSKKAAVVNDIFAMPDILRTGAASRAELVADDDTVTRVGANTIFSFDPASRTLDLQQGSLLFHSPHGKGGGTIHTGSATASVLGSTLIVTTTPNGGFKVIALEDDAEIHLKNGLKQKLKPGQMTFILPGGKQLAPILVFRLDELIRNSLLVKGFNQPLTSLPLILNQVARQTKLITSGRATDTGLLAGDNATPNGVEVLDANTIQSDVNAVKLAFGADATINQPSLAAAGIPDPPNHVFLNPAFTLAGSKFFGGRMFSGFAARNIFMNTPAAKASSVTVDLSAYAGRPEFDFVAANDLNLAGSVTFAGLAAADRLFLVAGNQISLAPNIALQANVADFELSAPGALALNGVLLLNNTGDLGLTSGSELNAGNGVLIHAAGHLNIAGEVAGGTPSAKALASGNPVSHVIVYGGNAILSGNAGVNISQAGISENSGNVYVTSSGGDITVAGATITAEPDAGTVSLQASSGSVTVQNTSIRAGYLTINSGDGILLDGTGATFTGSGAVNLTAPNLTTVNNANFSSFPVVNMAANTLNLSDVAFGAGSAVTLKSLLGWLNIGSSVPGDVNFIHNVTYGGNPAQNYVNNGGGITVSRLDGSVVMPPLPVP
jgi:hypothetical protein